MIRTDTDTSGRFVSRVAGHVCSKAVRSTGRHEANRTEHTEYNTYM